MSHNFYEYRMLPKLLYKSGNAAMSHQYCIAQCERRHFAVSGQPRVPCPLQIQPR